MTYRKTLLLSAYVFFALGAPQSFLMAQTGQETGGILIYDPLVIAKCGGCHRRNARSYLVVTIRTYIRYDQPEVSQ